MDVVWRRSIEVKERGAVNQWVIVVSSSFLGMVVGYYSERDRYFLQLRHFGFELLICLQGIFVISFRHFISF